MASHFCLRAGDAHECDVSLTDDLEEFVKTRVAFGRNSSPSDVVSEALRLLEIHNQTDAEKLEWLREANRVGIESGDGGELDFEAIKTEARALSVLKNNDRSSPPSADLAAPLRCPHASGDPVRPSFVLWNTGSPAFACDDGIL